MANNHNQKKLALAQCSNKVKNKKIGNNLLEQCSNIDEITEMKVIKKNLLMQCSNKKNKKKKNKKKKIDEMMEENQNQMKIIKKNLLMQCSNKKKKTEKESGEITPVSNLIQTFPDSSHTSKNVYICFSIPTATTNTDNVVMYKINPSNSTGCSNEEIPSITSVCSIPLSQVGYGFSPACIGSKLYTIGGGHFRNSGGSKDVYCIDTQDEILVPRKLEADTLANRLGSAVVSTHDNIYVFGAITGKPESWGEVFEPTLNQWSPLPKPPNQLLKGFDQIVHAVVGDKILMSREENLASFDLKTNSWELLFNPLRNCHQWNSNGTTEDDVLFMYNQGSVIAYDLVANKWFKEPVRALEIESMSFKDPNQLTQGSVVHIGEQYLCVIWFDIVEGSDREPCVRCVKFRVSRIFDTEKEEEVLQAEVQARSTYRMRSGGIYLVDCIPM